MNRTLEDKINRIKQHMFKDPKKPGFELTPHEQELKQQVERTFTIWIDKPWQAESELRNWAMHTFEMTDREARLLIHITKLLLGNVKSASREWHQHTFNEMVLKTFRMAEERKDLTAMNSASRNYGQFNRLDKELHESLPYDQIIPPDYDFTTDVSVLGLEPIQDVEALKKKIREAYLGKAQQIDFEEIEDEDDQD